MRVLLTLIAVLAITASASAIDGQNVGMVDDFESYLDDADLNAIWRTGVPWAPGSQAGTITLNYDDPLDQYMTITSDENGGQVCKKQDTLQDIWGGDLSTHWEFLIRGRVTNVFNEPLSHFQTQSGGAEGNASGYLFPIPDVDLTKYEWQHVRAIPVIPTWDSGPGWWGCGFNPFGHDASVTYDIDNVYLSPEPATMLLLGLGGLFLRRRK